MIPAIFALSIADAVIVQLLDVYLIETNIIMSKSERKIQLPAQPSHGYEFGGPYVLSRLQVRIDMLTLLSLVVFAASFGLPIVCYIAAFLCNDISGCPVPSVLYPKTLTAATLKADVGWPANGVLGLVDAEVTGWVLAYYLFSLLLQVVLPSIESEGVELSSGGRLKYKFNGKISWS